MDVGFGVPTSDSGALWFFCLQVGGIALETLVWRAGASLWLRVPRGVGRAVGFVWVAGFMLWTLPVWVNPILVQLFADGVRMMSPFLGMRGWWV
ncbi:hypothetical protein BO70DRAFT_162712 [Aspergillus heteromorphus CBS 117.55]|uniref:Apolipoprotein N-acyltransferase n=1 Tax=Aspergillus heteromorphus CBS 117.55 TaxID=1448321 RepID=A0A317WWJ7_9EURO|nr:uncharacterized protein BO70DRAFT_162712 [Aspergillus heteromorphus CBS 117.55]PWY89188.1 hypothetical protein BO70DRAFT_162712 [Aspergillus heteromorphus CBS 117.55]